MLDLSPFLEVDDEDVDEDELGSELLRRGMSCVFCQLSSHDEQ